MRTLFCFFLLITLISCNNDPASSSKANTPPIASFSVASPNGNTSTPITFDASESYDKEQPVSKLSFRWDWNGDGQWDTNFSNSQTVSYQFPFNDTFTIIMEVADTDGLSDSASASIKVVCDSMEVTDFDGNTYTAVKLGDDWWMTENLSVGHFQNGEAITYIHDNSLWTTQSNAAYSAYQHKKKHIETFGFLYNWFAVNDPRKIAPVGWHVASDEDWRNLEKILGMKKLDADSIGYRGNDEAIQLMETDFKALFGGIRLTDGSFNQINNLGYWWSATEYCRLNAWFRGLTKNYGLVNRNFDSKIMGLSVRCVKDK